MQIFLEYGHAFLGNHKPCWAKDPNKESAIVEAVRSLLSCRVTMYRTIPTNIQIPMMLNQTYLEKKRVRP